MVENILFSKIFFGTFLAIAGFVVVFLAFKLFYKYVIQEERCSSKTKGIVKKYTFASRGDGIHLPVVYYQVNGAEYTVVGPEYKFYIVKTKRSVATTENKTSFEETDDQKLIVTHHVNSFISIYRNPMRELYPIDSEIDVYYDPNNPKLSYVLRYCDRKFWFWSMVSIGFVAWFFDIFLLFFLFNYDSFL